MGLRVFVKSLIVALQLLALLKLIEKKIISILVFLNDTQHKPKN
jgi:hypothetical protein